MKVAFSHVAEQDLESLLSYINNELQNPIASENIGVKLLHRIQSLGSFPEIGAGLGSIDHRLSGYRYLVVDNYLVIYKVADQVSVIRILYARSDYVQLLQG